jgi:hypothetical protein
VKKARASPKLKHEYTCHKLTANFLTETNIKKLITVRNKNKITRNQLKKMKEIKCTKNKREKKIYAFPDHVDVQPIPSTLSSLEFDIPLKECVAILGGQLTCFEGSS